MYRRIVRPGKLEREERQQRKEGASFRFGVGVKTDQGKTVKERAIDGLIYQSKLFK